MARRTFGDMDTEIEIAFAKRRDITDAIRNHLLDSAYFYVANAIRHSELEATGTETLAIAGDTVAVETDMWFPELVFDATNGRPINPGELNTIEAVSKSSGPPTKYVRWGAYLRFDRKPTVETTINVFYTKRPAEPTAEGNSVLDWLYDQLIIMFAIKFGFEELRDFEQAAKLQTAINVYAGQMKVPWRMTRMEDREARIRVRTH